MLKHLSIIFSLFLTACMSHVFTTSSSKSNENAQPQPSYPTKTSSVKADYFIGNWACEMNGGNTGSSNTVQLTRDGYAYYLGTFTMPKEEPLFQYQLERIGTWSFSNDVLTYQFSKSNFTRAHTFEMLKKIKTDKTLNAEENAIFNGRSSQLNNSSSKPVSLSVSDFTDQSFVISQQLAETTRTGICKRIIE